MAMTKIENLIDPEVMSDMISGKLDKKVVVTPFAKVDTTLEGKAGDTITVPQYAYIGDAEDVAEGVEAGTVQLSATTTQAKVKKAMKAVTLTDEAVLSGYGNPVGETNTQIAKAIASKVDADAMSALQTAQLKYNPASLAVISYNGIVDAIDIFNEEFNSDKVIFVNPAQVGTLRKDTSFISADKIAETLMVTGAIGKIANAEVVASRKVVLVQYEKNAEGTIEIVADTVAETSTKKHLATIQKNINESVAVGDKVNALSASNQYYSCPIVRLNSDTDTEDDTPAITIYRKRDVNVETERHTLSRTTDISADEIYTVALSDASKVVLARFKA